MELGHVLIHIEPNEWRVYWKNELRIEEQLLFIELMKDNSRIFKMSFASVYPLYVQKVERKGQSKANVDAII